MQVNEEMLRDQARERTMRAMHLHDGGDSSRAFDAGWEAALAMRAKEAPCPDDVASLAEIIHGAMCHAVREFKGNPQPWQNGNSTAESYARSEARAALSSIQGGGTPVSVETVERVARAIGSTLQDDGKYALKMRLSFDEQVRAARAAIAAIGNGAFGIEDRIQPTPLEGTPK